jgi:hypothetical protein
MPDNTRTPDSEPEPALVVIRYSLAALLREVKRDRGAKAFAMEKLDQPAITSLFEQQQQQRDRRDPTSLQ